jgi:hypothetical protein
MTHPYNPSTVEAGAGKAILGCIAKSFLKKKKEREGGKKGGKGRREDGRKEGRKEF